MYEKNKIQIVFFLYEKEKKMLKRKVKQQNKYRFYKVMTKVNSSLSRYRTYFKNYKNAKKRKRIIQKENDKNKTRKSK